MKNILLAVLIMRVTAAAAQWTLVASPAGRKLEDIHFPEMLTGYCVGDSGSVYRSLDGGDSWQKIFSCDTIGFTSVYFTSKLTGYAAGGSIYKTTDGGISWLPVLTVQNDLIGEVFFLNAQKGFAGGNNAVYRTLDAGATWTQVISSNTGNFSAIYFPSPSTGYFIGGPGYGDQLFRTKDGGNTFTQITNQFQSIKESAHFINDTVGYMCGWYGSMLAKTTNGGQSWKQLDTVNEPQCWDVNFVTEQKGWCLAHDALRKTIDGGASWTIDLPNTFYGLKELYFPAPNVGFAVGKAAIYKMTVPSTGIEDHTSPDWSIQWMDGKKVLVAGTHAALYGCDGRLIASAANGQIDVSGLPDGLYLLMYNDRTTAAVKLALRRFE